MPLRPRDPVHRGAPGQQRNPTNARYCPATGRAYWEQQGGLAQFGAPLSKELPERSALNGQVYTVQYFERAVFEYHPENRVPYAVLLGQLGTRANPSRGARLSAARSIEES
jgi:hypothetical protein